MFKKLVVVLAIAGSVSSTGLAKNNPFGNKDFPDMGQSEEPGIQSDEDVGNFLKGQGIGPKNGNSFIHKGIKLKAPITGGTGCQSGTVAAALTEDKKTLSILFDNYIAEAGNSSGVRRDVKNCSVVIPMEVPAGMQFTVVKLDYRGFNSIPPNARTRYVTMYSMINADNNKQLGRRLRRQYDFYGPLEEEYIISSDISTRPLWSKCGKNLNFKIDTRVVAATNKRGDDVLATIDSIDASAETNVQYHLLWRSCADEAPPPNNNGGPGIGPKLGNGGGGPGIGPKPGNGGFGPFKPGIGKPFK